MARHYDCDMPADLHTAAKVAAFAAGSTLKEWIRDAMRRKLVSDSHIPLARNPIKPFVRDGGKRKRNK